MMASSTSRPSAMMSAPSEILCRPTPQYFITRKVTARTRGMAMATTRPGQTIQAPGPGVQAQTQEADGQDHEHGLHQHLDELPDGRGHGGRLVLDLRQLDADGQFVAQTLGGFGQALAQGDDVAALGHGDAQRDHVLALVANLGGGGVFIATTDGGDVAQLEGAGLLGDRIG